MKIGAYYSPADGTCRFCVWAPEKSSMTLQLLSPEEKCLPMQRDSFGYFSLHVDDCPPGTRYLFQPDEDQAWPDPASFFQPEGVHGPSEVVSHDAFHWQDEGWNCPPLGELVLYELHVGTFTPEGTFGAIIPRIDALLEVGINAIELMPVAQFPGSRNWGYDGVFTYAVQASYGGPEGLKKLVNACHQKGMAIFLDVVYNHLGPEGNYLTRFAPYFTHRYHTPWGDAINFDDEWSDGVRDYFAGNAVYWQEAFHLDGLRCDAIHAIFDFGAAHFWTLLRSRVDEMEKRTGRRFQLIAESDLNNPRVVRPVANDGFGFDAQWLDDFHHALYAPLNPQDKQRYYDYGSMAQLAKAYTDGFVFSGEWVRFRKRKFGASSRGIPGNRLVVFKNNHDQAGNRAGGERLSVLVDFERLKLGAAALLLAPYVPMLFMGEEYADESPFMYFVSHSDEGLIKAVREGRKEEFKAFGQDLSLHDPQSEDSFLESKVRWLRRTQGRHAIMLEWHRRLLGMRRSLAPLKNFDKESVSASPIKNDGLMLIRRSPDGKEGVMALMNFSEEPLEALLPSGTGKGRKILDSKEAEWTSGGGAAMAPAHCEAGLKLSLAPLSIAVYQW
jgi:maltooligosyltrehalose trehalohydrolase